MFCSDSIILKVYFMVTRLKYTIYQKWHYISSQNWVELTWFHEASKTGIHAPWHLLLSAQKTLGTIRRDDCHDGYGICSWVAGVMNTTVATAVCRRIESNNDNYVSITFIFIIFYPHSKCHLYKECTIESF